ncbi:MAG: serine hydrolase domain-containing protein [Terriglobales bacterium]
MLLRCAFLVLLSSSALAQSSRDLSAVFSDLTPTDPGCAALVVNHGKTVFQQGYGLADLERRTPITPTTNFRLASVTKQFTATAIMLLVKDGKLTYDTRLTDIFSDFPAYGRDITVRNLLNHTSGLPDYEDLWDSQFPNTPAAELPQVRDAQVLQLMKSQSKGKFSPGTRFSYSNSGYSVLSQIVQKVSGQPFEDFLHARIFQPLGMTNTVAFINTRNSVSNRAYGYRKDNGRWIFSDQSSTSAVLGDGGVYSSLADFQKWIDALRTHKLLTAAEMAPALTPGNARQFDPPTSEEFVRYGFGWFLDPYKGHRRMYHYGETIGFLTNIQYFPDDDLGIVVLCNRTDVPPERRAMKIADMFLSVKNER